MTDEAELLQRLRNREKNSIDEAIQIYTPYLSTVLYHMAGNSLPKEDIEEIKKIQFEILSNCSKYLKEGGELVYSTCSILKQENEEVINKFIKENNSFIIEKIDLKNKNFLKKVSKFDKYLQIYQNTKTDGFFICKIQKK